MQSKFNNLYMVSSDIEAERLRLAELLKIRLKLKEDLQKIKEARAKRVIPTDLHLDYFSK